MTRLTRCLAAWLATFAILLGALAPALSHALSYAGSATHTVQVCTLAGMKTVVVDDNGERTPAGGDAPVFPSGHCGICATHGAAPMLPSTPSLPYALKGGSDPVPARFLGAPRPLFAWAASQPRAPPAFV